MNWGPDAPGARSPRLLARHVSVPTATLIVAAIMVGSGVATYDVFSPAFQSPHGSPWRPVTALYIQDVASVACPDSPAGNCTVVSKDVSLPGDSKTVDAVTMTVLHDGGQSGPMCSLPALFTPSSPIQTCSFSLTGIGRLNSSSLYGSLTSCDLCPGPSGNASAVLPCGAYTAAVTVEGVNSPAFAFSASIEVVVWGQWTG
jgi:hypothetical protein